MFGNWELNHFKAEVVSMHMDNDTSAVTQFSVLSLLTMSASHRRKLVEETFFRGKKLNSVPFSISS